MKSSISGSTNVKWASSTKPRQARQQSDLGHMQFSAADFPAVMELLAQRSKHSCPVNKLFTHAACHLDGSIDKPHPTDWSQSLLQDVY